ncbi:phosphoglycerate mutase [Colletotrichum truncatum]|uniref:Phosphoglycerate mutase n=1 Tax=Colletotrichum truncatum TaxID=5467 RepID=A0ACC3YC46_COLTU|nr:phosphoglycerate mutase [Colletotrichum truncatum]KAF6793926.1 phosphoglycerate mutase [Colletotrichum truncatum]
MSDRDAKTPRVVVMRHGETEWAAKGYFTGKTEIDLTPNGVKQVESTASLIVGAGKLLEPSRLAHIIVSPRKRTQRTLDLLALSPSEFHAVIVCTEDMREWDYGDYEGMTDVDIRKLRKSRGLDKIREWNIWEDGCEGGESNQEVTERVDRIITQIRDLQSPCMHGGKAADVLIVAHGLILRCFMKRWIGYEIENPLPMTFSPGAVAVMSYRKEDVNQPVFHLGLALPSAPHA